jgi:hypothetical protein
MAARGIDSAPPLGPGEEQCRPRRATRELSSSEHSSTRSFSSPKATARGHLFPSTAESGLFSNAGPLAFAEEPDEAQALKALRFRDRQENR